jgi:hypothetical protein
MAEETGISLEAGIEPARHPGVDRPEKSLVVLLTFHDLGHCFTSAGFPTVADYSLADPLIMQRFRTIGHVLRTHDHSNPWG